MATFIVTITNDDDEVLLSQEVEMDHAAGSNIEQAREGHLSGLTEAEYQARLAATLVGLEVCPWDCSYCRE